MIKIEIRPEWLLKDQDGSEVGLPLLLKLLAAVHEQGSISRAAYTTGLSYRHAWGLLRTFQKQFGATLVQKVRGQGSSLSPLAEKLIWADKRIVARLSPYLDSLASELEQELSVLLKGDRRALRITASHGFAVDVLIRQLEAENMTVDLRYLSSTEAVAALSRGECDLAGFHLPIGEFQHAAALKYLKWLDVQQHQLIHLANRTQGLFIAKGNPKRLQGLSDLTRKDVRFANRQSGSGTRMLLELLLSKHKIQPADISGYGGAEYTHAAVAAYVASGMADVSFGVETAARRFDLDFIPIVREQYFFAFQQRQLNTPLMMAALKIMQDKGFRSKISELPGYDGTESGSVLSLDMFL